MRKLFALVLVVLVASAGCTPAPVAPSATPSPAAPPAAATQPGPAPSTTPTGAAQAVISPTAPPHDRVPPTLSITVDPAEVAWGSQSVITVHASDPMGIREIAVLLGDQVLAAGDGEELRLDFIPGAIDGLKGDTSYTLVARATDLTDNTAETTVLIRVGPQPAATSTPALTAAVGQPATPAPVQDVTPEPRGSTTYRVTEIKLPTYPYAAYLKPAVVPELADYPLSIFDRPAYEAGNPRPEIKAHRLLVLENRYLRLGILPDLGGRIYECVFKPTGANEFYANTVIKPTAWGPASPAGAAWWVAAGGLEWGFPVEEHGYEFGTVWGFDHVTLDDGGVMVTLFTKTGPEKPYAVVDVILPPDTAYFVVQPRVVNPLGAAFKFKFWENALLAPGKANSVSPDLRLIFPASQVTVHATGDPSLPQAGQTASWPAINGKDFSRLGNWPDYLGVFAAPPTVSPGASAFAAVYDPGADEGMVRVFPAEVARGVKLFAPRGADGLDPALWTDDGSTYVELHGGFTPTFDEWHELDPGAEAAWSEYWYPVAQIGGVTFANDRAALSFEPSAAAGQRGLSVALFPTRAVSGRLTVTLPGAAPATFDVALSPDQPFSRDLPLDPAAGQTGQVSVTLEAGGQTVFEWTGAVQLR